MKMKDVLVLGASIFLFDTMLTLGLWTGLVLLQCSTCGGLTAVWAFGVLKWVILHHFTLILNDGKTQTVLSRLVVLLCLLSPVFESGRSLVAPPSEPHPGPSPDISMLLLGPTCSLLACVVWEIGLCADGKMKNNKLDTTQLLLRMLNYFKPDTLYVIAAFSFLTLAVVCDTLIPWYQGKVIDMLKGEALESSFCYSVGQLALISVGSSLFSGLRGGMFMCTLSRLNRRLKHLLFHTLLQQEVHFFVENSPGHLSSRLHCDIAKMGCTVALNANALVRSTMKTFLTLTLMLHLSWELTVLTCIEIPLVAIMQKKYISLSSELKMNIQECQAQTEGLALQTFTRIRVVRSFKGEKEEVRRYAEAVNHMHSLKRRKQLYGVMYGLIRTVVSLGIKVFMLLQARSLISSGHLTTGTLVSFFLYQKPLSRSSNEILYSYGDTMSTVGIISTVFGYLDRKPEGKEQGELAPEKLEGRIVFQNVTFSYPSASADKTALKSISLEIAAGKITALVGPSGSGKSSCISLIKRLYEPQEGQILLDGKPLHYYKSKYLHQKVAVVSQDLELFSGSLRYNIEYGLKGCTIERMREAAKKANAEAIIPELKNEYDKDLGGCGITFSCGQQYCIGLLRALVRHPQVIILDETTSKVDAEVWNAVLQEVLSVGGTVLMVAHNLESVKMLDHIIFIENGEVAEEGTHQELVAMNGRYYRFYQNSSK